MTAHTCQLWLYALGAAGAVLLLHSLYYLFVALFGFKRREAAPKAAPTTRFAVLIAARNEEQVIGPLVDSLKKQNYPKEMFDIIVAPNNCTDNTRATALLHGAQVFDPKGKVRSKGEVLCQLVDKLLRKGRHDAICVFDADNLVHPDFLQRMNNAYVSGARVAQGFRDSKNPTDTAVSTCYSVCYWMVNRFYNGGREALGLSGLVNGSGFMAGLDLLAELGGWNTHTMTEDYEFSAQCVLAGQRVHYVPEAVIYDEQPLTFLQSWKQRRRWSTGSVQSMEGYLFKLARKAVREQDFASFDMALTFAGPVVQLISLLLGGASAALTVWRLLALGGFTVETLALFAGGALLVALLACTGIAAGMVLSGRHGQVRGSIRGILAFSLFLLSWVPICVISVFKPQKTWDAIAHTRAVAIGDIGRAA